MKPVSKCDSASPPSHARFLPALTLVLCFAFSLNALAFYSSLQPEQVEEAYWLGRTSDRDELTAFLKQYQHDFPYPPDRPTAYVQSIEFQTPYEQVVSRSQMGGARYSRDQAMEAYQANPGLVIVRVVFALPVQYAGPIPASDTFTVRVYQTNSIEPRKLTTKASCGPPNALPQPYNNTLPLYSINGDCAPYPYTIELDLQFDADQFAPGPVTVKGIVPSGALQETRFNLNKLK